MLKVGLTGGYASGKSFVAGELERLGCQVIYADQLGHAVLRPDGEAYAPAVAEFGPEIINADGTIDRKRLAAIVFSSAAKLEILNGFVHPAVFRLEEKMLREIEQRATGAIAVVEAAILIETGRYRAFDRIVLTACREEIQIRRGMERDGLTREQVMARLSRQMSLAQKEQLADYVIRTDTTPEQTKQQVEHVFDELKKLQVHGA